MSFEITRRTALASGIALVAVGPAAAGTGPVFTSWGKAASGYDVVAYFTESRPVKGSSSYTAEFQGATWHFASASNRDLFRSNPDQYAPKYGGYCAYAVGNGDLDVPTVPEAWKIVDGKLYLNYSRGIQSTWERRLAGYIADGDRNWARAYG